MARERFGPALVIQFPRGGSVERTLTEEPPDSVASGSVALEAAPTDPLGNLEAAAAGQVVISVPSPESLRREADNVHHVISRAGVGTEPLVVVVEAASEIREEELAAVVAAAGHTSRDVILRIAREG